MSFVSRLLRYGNWSGPGWSNGNNFGGRILTEPELQTPGIDAYDNYVSKCHDLNETFASYTLRRELAAASPAHSDLLLRNGAGHYAKPLVFEPISDLLSNPRFVSFDRYVSEAKPNEKRAVAEAFYSYCDQVMRSNLQFAIDYVWNEVEFVSIKTPLMMAELGFASHVFLNEATWLDAQMRRLRQSEGVSDAYIRQSDIAMRFRFVSPHFGNNPSRYITPGRRRFVRKVGVETLLIADRESLVRQAVDIRRLKNRTRH